MPDIKLRCTACGKRHLADSQTYGTKANCQECGAPLDTLCFTTPERTRAVAAAVKRNERKIILDALVYPLMRIEPGRFFAGAETASPAESPEHEVCLTQPVWMGICPISQLEYRHIMRGNPSAFPGLDRPVENVCWFEAQEFCQRLTKRLRKMHFLNDTLNVRLPTEAEWEYASRTHPPDKEESNPQESQGRRTISKYGWDDTLETLAEFAWFSGNSNEQTHPVGQKKANLRNLHDLHGNVSEWCEDWYAAYPADLQVNPQGPASGTEKVRRGGSWASLARRCRGTDRVGVNPQCRSALLGFRVVLAYT